MTESRVELVGVALAAAVLEQRLPSSSRRPTTAQLCRETTWARSFASVPLLRVGKALVELLRDGEPEDAVPEELESLVGIRPVRRPRGMREGVAEALLGQGVDQLEKGCVGALRPALVTGGTRCSRRPVRQS